MKTISNKNHFDIYNLIETQKKENLYESIFSIYKKLNRTDDEVKELCYKYSDTYQKWFRFNSNLDKIVEENTKYICNYTESMEITKDENGEELFVSFPCNSSYTDNGNYENINDWVWKRTDGMDKFSFDSEAEREWAYIMKEISNIRLKDNKSIVKSVLTGKKNRNRGAINIFNEVEKEKINPKEKFLWGKNFTTNSNIKFEYYLNGIYSSYPDFIMKDCFERIHIFEVKSVNLSSNLNIDSNKYKEKIEELKKCYKQASILTKYYFYLPILKDDIWFITKFDNGEESTITKEQLIEQLERG